MYYHRKVGSPLQLNKSFFKKIILTWKYRFSDVILVGKHISKNVCELNHLLNCTLIIFIGHILSNTTAYLSAIQFTEKSHTYPLVINRYLKSVPSSTLHLNSVLWKSWLLWPQQVYIDVFILTNVPPAPKKEKSHTPSYRWHPDL